MGDIDLFYEIKNLFNTSKEAFEIFDYLRYTIQNPHNNKILYITLNRRARDELMNKYNTLTNFERINENTLRAYNQEKHEEKYVEIRTIESIVKGKFLEGRRYKEVRFYQ